MAVELARPLQLRRKTGRPGAKSVLAQQAPKISQNALLGIGLWFFLWSGYNTDITRFMSPGFPADNLDLFHGLRAFGPMLAGWFAGLVIFTRANRLFPWIMGPLGLMVLYAVTGLVSSAIISTDPVYALYFGANYLAIVLVLLAIVLVENPLHDLLMVLRFTWFVGIMLTLALLGAIPIWVRRSSSPPMSARLARGAYSGHTWCWEWLQLEILGLRGMQPSPPWHRCLDYEER